MEEMINWLEMNWPLLVLIFIVMVWIGFSFYRKRQERKRLMEDKQREEQELKAKEEQNKLPSEIGLTPKTMDEQRKLLLDKYRRLEVCFGQVVKDMAEMDIRKSNLQEEMDKIKCEYNDLSAIIDRRS